MGSSVNEDPAVVKIGGKPFRNIIARYLATRFDEDLDIYVEVNLGRSIIGKRRKADVLAVTKEGSRALAFETKYQGVPGTTDEKILYALEDCRAMPIPALIVWAGAGWSDGTVRLLRASGLAVEVHLNTAKGEVTEATELEAFVAVQFGLWKRFLNGKRRMEP